MPALIYSSDAWRLLNGIVSIYKPPGMSPKFLLKMLQNRIVSDLNRMQRRVDPSFLVSAGADLNRGSSRIDQRAVCQLADSTSDSAPLAIDGRAAAPAVTLAVDSEGNLVGPAPLLVDSGGGGLSVNSSGKLADTGTDSWPGAAIQDYSSHPLVLGPAYEASDVQLHAANIVSSRCSGLMVVGINEGCETAAAFRSTRPLLSCQLVGEWGQATATGFADSKTIAKATWRHLKGKQWRLEHILSSVQAAHQKMAWTVAEVDIKSQEAYDLAVQGPVKPASLSDTLIYGIRVRNYSPPEFKLDIQYIGENHRFLLDLVSEIGIRCKTFAHTKKFRVGQVGWFTADTALVPQEFSLQSVLQNMHTCQTIIDRNGGIQKTHVVKSASEQQHHDPAHGSLDYDCDSDNGISSSEECDNFSHIQNNPVRNTS